MHIHLDPLGGVAGDMFVAALLDAWPKLANETIATVRLAGLDEGVRLEHLPFRDDVLTGSRFAVSLATGPAGGHDHVHWRNLRSDLAASALPTGVRDRAIAIFSMLAEAEAGIHGMPVDEATFHEVGSWDSIADIVAAAFLIEAIGAASWSIAPLPLGSGRVRCAHGELPVPAPATMRLLEGFVFHDDGRPGERVTPTGAAILKHLQPRTEAASRAGRLVRTGYGFGTRRLEGMSNVLRVSAFAPTAGSEAAATDAAFDGKVGVISFEIDDQTGEDLAIGLDHLRRRDGVLDILQTPAFGKKGRLVTAIRLLADVDAIDAAIDACFAETTTLGVRWRVEARRTLKRQSRLTDGGARVKLARRPDGGMTAKAESDDLKNQIGHRARQDSRRTAEASALAGRKPEGEA